jgi:hypothetical protein
MDNLNQQFNDFRLKGSSGSQYLPNQLEKQDMVSTK